MTYILFLYLTIFSANGGNTVTSAEFATQEKCERAAKQAESAFKSYYTQVRFVCVTK